MKKINCKTVYRVVPFNTPAISHMYLLSTGKGPKKDAKYVINNFALITSWNDIGCTGLNKMYC